MSKQTTGQRIAGKWIEESTGLETLARRIDLATARAATKAATFAMMAERYRIKRAINIRASTLKGGPLCVLMDVLADIEGPLSGAPTKGFLPIPKPARKPKCRTCKGEGTLSVGGADGIKCWTCGKRKAKKRSKR